MTIWPLQAWQIPQMAQIERLCFSDPWSQKALEEELENPLALYFVACEGEQVLGYVGTRMVCGQCDVTNVAVHPRCRRQGIGRRLMEALVEHCKVRGITPLQLEVRVSNQPAIALYQALGFVRQGVRPNYYQDPREDALLMARDLGDGRDREDMNILAIETSCDETAAAVSQDGRKILADVVYSQADMHALYGGVVPEIASRKHIEKISLVADEALRRAGIQRGQIDAVAATYAPGLIGALLVGANFAKACAQALGVPFIPVHHIRGHIAANYVAFPSWSRPFWHWWHRGGTRSWPTWQTIRR